jgi:VIT1/CCC1 family predicted Fe2+/Mn2+ transporter
MDGLFSASENDCSVGITIPVPTCDTMARMPLTPHIEQHFTAGDVVRDIVIGMADGLTVPFALAAGLSGAVASSGIVVTAGLAEVAAGSIAMGLGGYLAARSDAEHYAAERMREQAEIVEKNDAERAETDAIFRGYGLTAEESAPLVAALARRPQAWVDFMMRFELGLEKPQPGRAPRSAMTIAGSYVAGGLLPLAPYMALHDAREALLVSVGVTLVALLVFGYVKGRFTGTTPVRSALQTALVGSVAAAAAFVIARLIA